MGSSSTPKAPDPVETAGAQGKENRATLQYQLDNQRVSTANPFGSTGWTNRRSFDQAGFDSAMAGYRSRLDASTSRSAAEAAAYSGGGLSQNGERPYPAYPVETAPFSEQAPSRDAFSGRDDWLQTTTLSPDSQAIYDSSTGKLKQAVNNISTDSNAYSQRMADAIYSRMRRYQDPADAADRNAQRSDLADRGFQVGNEAYSTEADRLDKTQQMARADAADRAQIGGFAQGQQELSMQQQIAQVLSGLRNQQVAGVTGSGGGGGNASTPSIAPVDIAALTQGSYEDSVNRANAERATRRAQGSAVGGVIGGVAGTFMGGNTMAGASMGSAVGGSFYGS